MPRKKTTPDAEKKAAAPKAAVKAAAAKAPAKSAAAKTAAKTAAKPRVARKPTACVVCGAEVAPFSTEELCWVCRRLKISAWRDVENQSAMQE